MGTGWLLQFHRDGNCLFKKVRRVSHSWCPDRNVCEFDEWFSYLSKVRPGSQSCDNSYVVVSYNLYQSSSDTVHLSTHIPSVNNVVTLNQKSVFKTTFFLARTSRLDDAPAKDQRFLETAVASIQGNFSARSRLPCKNFLPGAIWFGIHKRRFRTRLGCLLQTSIAKSGVNCLMLQKPL